MSNHMSRFSLFFKHHFSLLLLTIQYRFFAVDRSWSYTFGIRLQESSAKSLRRTRTHPPCYWSRPLTRRLSEVLISICNIGCLQLHICSLCSLMGFSWYNRYSCLDLNVLFACIYGLRCPTYHRLLPLVNIHVFCFYSLTRWSARVTSLQWLTESMISTLSQVGL